MARKRGGWISRVVLAGIVALVCGVPASAESVAQSKTLRRFHDPVVVATSFAAEVPAMATQSFRLFASRRGRLEPIPYQFDASNDEGDVETSAHGGTDFALDDNDELVFMAKDSGDRVDAADLPRGRAAFEIEVADPLSEGRGWVYLIAFTNPPPASPIRYVSFDHERNEASSEYYTVSYDGELEVLNGLRIHERAGGDGRNLILGTRMRGRPTFRLLLVNWTPEFTEQNTGLRLQGIQAGPVRVTRRLRLSIDLGAFFPDLPQGKADTQYYMSSFVVPAYMSVPKLALKLLKKFSFESVADFRPPTNGMRYWDGANPDGVVLDEEPDTRIHSDVDHDWWVVSGQAGTFLHAFLISDLWRSWGIIRGTVFKNGATDAPSVGYSLLGMTGMRDGGKHEMRRATVILPRPYERGDEDLPMAMLKHPLAASVRRLHTATMEGVTEARTDTF